MSWLEALILGLVQGLTEFLPVSSSGHIELGKFILGTESADNLMFSVLVHTATMLSIVVVFRKDIWQLITHTLRFEWNPETRFVLLIVISMIPTGIVGLLFESQIEQFFDGRIMFVGFMLLVTATILISTRLVKTNNKEVSFLKAFIIGLAQTVAILPGISRSGATIGTALLLGVERNAATRFSFLMVLPPIAGATLIKLKDLFASPALYQEEIVPLGIGFIAAFISGIIACSWMLSLVRKGNISYFSIYCLVIGLIAIAVSIF
jgi:undecaprenyl-diphosphatase